MFNEEFTKLVQEFEASVVALYSSRTKDLRVLDYNARYVQALNKCNKLREKLINVYVCKGY